jgi:YesN/AraC family two-component response regulator
MQKVLIVDDSKISRKKMSALIQELGYEICAEAVDGVDGYEKYSELKPDMIISDIEMPNMNGLELVQKIRESDSSVNIVVASSIVNASTIKKALSFNTQVVKKPVKIDRLKHAIELLNR